MTKIKRATLEAIIANAVDQIVGAVSPGNKADARKVAHQLGLTDAQAERAIDVTFEVSSRGGWKS